MNQLLTRIGCALLLLLLLPLLLVLALLVWCTMGRREVLFRQARPGLDGLPFTLYKFRTMTDEHDDSGNLLPDEQRMTWSGRLLRSTSLDELPQLYNIVKGDMNIVGPRPLLVRYLPYYTEREQKRHSVRPGLTGWAQVNGRTNLQWDEKLALDVWYVENRTFLLDLEILVKSCWLVIRRKGVAPGPEGPQLDLDMERRERPANQHPPDPEP
jgi:sugar transferase EpsL